jgi:IclR family transcriptional regulator, acetate operon repressor
MASSIRSVASAFAILRLLANSGPLTLTGIGQELGLSPSSCLNLLRTLVDQGAVERESKAKLYRLARSWAETRLFDADRDRAMAERLRAAMAQVATGHEATVGLWKVAPGRRLQLIAHAECNAAMRIQLADGQRQPIGGGAVGRALAAAERPGDAELARRFAEVRWQSPLPLSAYLEQIAEAAQQGFAIDEAATFTGVTSLAAVVGEERPAYLVSASIFAGSRSQVELRALGASLTRIGEAGSTR